MPGVIVSRNGTVAIILSAREVECVAEFAAGMGMGIHQAMREGVRAFREGREATGRAWVRQALGRHYYLGFKGTVGENLQYTISDGQGRRLGCLVFGAAAWKGQDRDQFIGWSAEQREKNLALIANDTPPLSSIPERVANPSKRSLLLMRQTSVDHTRPLQKAWRDRQSAPRDVTER